MLERQVVIPASPDQLWDALTEPASVSAWFGSQVDWELRPGGQARFVDDDGTARQGIIDAVVPQRHLSFRWWRDDAIGDPASQVTYRLEPDEDGTRLTVTEQLVPPPSVSARLDPSASAAVASGSSGVRASTPGSAGPGWWSEWDSRLFWSWSWFWAQAAGSWTDWDSRLFQCWAQATAAAGVGPAIG